MEFVVITGNSPEINELRAQIKAALSTKYTGWSDVFDKQFDTHSVWFGLKKNSKWVATCKLIFKQHDGKELKLPIESGDLQTFSMPSTEGVCEGSGLSMTGERYIATLLYCMGRWMTQNKIGWVYSIVDTRNQRLQYLYQTVGFEFLPEKYVCFSDFCYKDDNSPVLWQVIRLSPERFQSQQAYDTLELLGATAL